MHRIHRTQGSVFAPPNLRTHAIMKRIQSLTDTKTTPAPNTLQLSTSPPTIQHPPSLDLAMARTTADAPCAPQAVFSPMHYESGYAYPLVVWLHGDGDDERQLRRVMPIVSMRNFVAVAPRGTVSGPSPEQGASDSPGFGWEQSESHIEEAADRVFDSVAFARGTLHNRCFENLPSWLSNRRDDGPSTGASFPERVRRRRFDGRDAFRRGSDRCDMSRRCAKRRCCFRWDEPARFTQNPNFAAISNSPIPPDSRSQSANIRAAMN